MQTSMWCYRACLWKLTFTCCVPTYFSGNSDSSPASRRPVLCGYRDIWLTCIVPWHSVLFLSAIAMGAVLIGCSGSPAGSQHWGQLSLPVVRGQPKNPELINISLSVYATLKMKTKPLKLLYGITKHQKAHGAWWPGRGGTSRPV